MRSYSRQGVGLEIGWLRFDPWHSNIIPQASLGVIRVQSKELSWSIADMSQFPKLSFNLPSSQSYSDERIEKAILLIKILKYNLILISDNNWLRRCYWNTSHDISDTQNKEQILYDLKIKLKHINMFILCWYKVLLLKRKQLMVGI